MDVDKELIPLHRKENQLKQKKKEEKEKAKAVNRMLVFPVLSTFPDTESSLILPFMSLFAIPYPFYQTPNVFLDVPNS